MVTHHRLEAGPDGRLVPAGPLEEPLVVRPTCETIIGAMFAKWVAVLPRPAAAHQPVGQRRALGDAHAAVPAHHRVPLAGGPHRARDARRRRRRRRCSMLDVYADFAETDMAMPVIKGEKTESERFPGAVDTYCIEAMMQDRKALQAGTSHFLGQNFAKASDIKFLDETGELVHAWTTSWGVSTRLDRRPDHDPRRRRRPRAAAAARAGARRDHARSRSRPTIREAVMNYCRESAPTTLQRQSVRRPLRRGRDRRPRHPRRRQGVVVDQEGRSDPARDRPARHGGGLRLHGPAGSAPPREAEHQAAEF